MKLQSLPNFKEEQLLWEKGCPHVIGMDEVGRGAFAGPIVAAAVIYSPNFNSNFLTRINDSKLLSANVREELSKLIKKSCLIFEIEEVEIEFINKYGIGKANKEVFQRVLKKVLQHGINDYFALLDGSNAYLTGSKQKTIIKGDQKSISIASASILAKVYRDNLMKSYAKKFTSYNFAANKGYGTKSHQKALFDHGVSPIHRTSFHLEKFLSV